jgi:hypothetical protein
VRFRHPGPSIDDRFAPKLGTLPVDAHEIGTRGMKVSEFGTVRIKIGGVWRDKWGQTSPDPAT